MARPDVSDSGPSASHRWPISVGSTRPLWGVIVNSSFSVAMIVLMLAITGCGQRAAEPPLEHAESDFASGQWAQASAACNALIEENPNDAGAYLLRGRAQQCSGRLDMALADLTKAISLDPKRSREFYQRPVCIRRWAKWTSSSRTKSPPVRSIAFIKPCLALMISILWC